MNGKKMKALLRHGKGKLHTMDVERPDLRAGWVLMQVICAGPCGTDWHRLDGTDTKERPGYDLQPLGHEFGGRVAAVGPGGDPSLIGRDFAVAPLVPCHVCEPCRDGSFAQCRRYQFIGSNLAKKANKK